MLTAPANPYAGYGPPVSEPEFVGRAGQIRVTRNRTFASLETASVAVVGPPRVGKSSLAQYALEKFAVGRSTKGLTFAPVWITVAGLDSEQALFCELVSKIQTWLADLDEHAVKLQPLHDAMLASSEWADMRRCLLKYLRQVRKHGYQVVAVLDEFDAARSIFRGSAPFELLRAIAHEREVRVALITASRRDLADVVIQSTAELSTFPQIFGVPVTLGCFDDEELTALIARSPYTDPELRRALFDWLVRETGGQPYLASALLSFLHDRWAEEGAAPAQPELERHFGEAVSACSQLTVRHYEQMLELLREEGRLTILLEVLFGPQVTAGPLDAERLASEGIIRKTDDGWVAFSENFQQYLSLLERTSDAWPLWQKTETQLRRTLAEALERAYGQDWLIRLTESQARMVSECQSRRDHARRGFGELAPDDNLFEYAYPHELLSVIMMHWEHLEPAFGQSRDAWRERLELVARMRTPMAHNRRSGTSPLLMEQFRQYCQDILEWLSPQGA